MTRLRNALIQNPFALAGLGDYPGALAALEQTRELECREEERTQVQSDIQTEPYAKQFVSIK